MTIAARAFEPQLDLRPAQLHVVAPEVAAHVVAPAAEALPADERDRLVAAEPFSLFGVLGVEGESGADAGTRAGDRVRELVAAGSFTALGPTLAFHELSRDGHRQLGLVAEVPVAHCDDGLVRPHEATRRDHEQRLAAFVVAAGMDVSPVAVAYRARDTVDAIAAAATAASPDIEVKARDGVAHKVWLVQDRNLIGQLQAAFAEVDQLTIVDGHHRVAAAAHRARLRPDETTFLAVLYPDRDLDFAGYDRCVATDLASDRLLAALGEVGELTLADTAAARPSAGDDVLVYAAQAWHHLAFPDPPRGVPERLAVMLVHDRVLRPVFGIDDPRGDPRLDYVPGVVPLAQLAAACGGGGKVAFALPPVTLDELQEVAARGVLLPPKATYSDPKPGAGLFLRLRSR